MTIDECISKCKMQYESCYGNGTNFDFMLSTDRGTKTRARKERTGPRPTPHHGVAEANARFDALSRPDSAPR